jgi:hypothetical protein
MSLGTGSPLTTSKPLEFLYSWIKNFVRKVTWKLAAVIRNADIHKLRHSKPNITVDLVIELYKAVLVVLITTFYIDFVLIISLLSIFEYFLFLYNVTCHCNEHVSVGNSLLKFNGIYRVINSLINNQLKPDGPDTLDHGYSNYVLRSNFGPPKT